MLLSGVLSFDQSAGKGIERSLSGMVKLGCKCCNGGCNQFPGLSSGLLVSTSIVGHEVRGQVLQRASQLGGVTGLRLIVLVFVKEKIKDKEGIFARQRE